MTNLIMRSLWDLWQESRRLQISGKNVRIHPWKKRVELHLHTVMSDNDSVVQIKDIVNRAYEWGHPAVAITDHGVLQGFPIARHAYEDLRLKEDDPFKIIYGVEGYFVDDLGD